MITFDGVDVGELGLFRKKKKKPAAPAEPPPPPEAAAPPGSALFLETKKTPGFPWLVVSIITASVLVIGVSAFLILKKPKKA